MRRIDSELAAVISRLSNRFTPWELVQISKEVQKRINDAYDAGDMDALTVAADEAAAEMEDRRDRNRIAEEQRRTALIHRAFPHLTYEEVRELAKIMKEMR